MFNFDFSWDIFKWATFIWYRPDVLKSFQYEKPFFLYLIPFIPVLFFLRWLFNYQFRQKLKFAVPGKKKISSPITLLRFIPDIILIFFIANLLIALARPQKSNETVEQTSEGIDIVLALDISESMMIEDFIPNRLEAAKVVAKKFIKGRFQDRIGLVVFAGQAFSLSPLTTDYKLLTSFIDEIKFNAVGERGTAIGSALAVSINRLKESIAKSKVLILISDGENTAGNIDPITAAELAKAYKIKIYTIGVGRNGLVPYGKDPFGNPRMVENMLDESTLRQIAQIGDGKFYRASNIKALKDIFTNINQYEKAEIKEKRYKDTKDYYNNYLYWALLSMVIWMFLKTTFISNILED